MDIFFALAVIILPVFLWFVVKAHAGVVFLSSMVGIILIQNIDLDLLSVVGGGNTSVSRLALIAGLLGLTGLLFYGSVRNNVQRLVHGCIALLNMIVLWLLLPTQRGMNGLDSLVLNDYYSQVQPFMTVILGAAFLLSLLTLLHKKDT